jgi:hypothetical protein
MHELGITSLFGDDAAAQKAPGTAQNATGYLTFLCKARRIEPL